jgi:TonB family protein
MNVRSCVVAALCSFAIPATPASAQARLETSAARDASDRQSPGGAGLERVRSLYVAAAYEEALAAMPPDATGAVRRDLEQYRALCLLALGREAEAVSAIERLVKNDPTYLPSDSDTSPRMRSIFSVVRSRVVPEMARETYGAAKSAFAAKEVESAQTGFRRTLELIDSLPDPDKDTLDDLRVLVAGFLDLITASPAALAAPAPPGETLDGKPESVAEYVPPVAVREELPGWTPPDGAAQRSEYVGLLRVMIGTDGRVTSATMVKSSHPVYDAAAVRASKTWIYRPATRAGRPVTAQKDIQVRLLPR